MPTTPHRSDAAFLAALLRLLGPDGKLVLDSGPLVRQRWFCGLGASPSAEVCFASSPLTRSCNKPQDETHRASVNAALVLAGCVGVEVDGHGCSVGRKPTWEVRDASEPRALCALQVD